MARRRNPLLLWLIRTLGIGVTKAFGKLPLPVARSVARCFVPVVYYLVPRVRKVGLANLELAYGNELSAADRTRILKQAVENMLLVAAEFPHIPKLRGEFLERNTAIEGREFLEPIKGRIIVGAHLGNWEWLAAVTANSGIPSSEIVRPFDDPKLNDFIDGMRRSGNVVTIPKDNAAMEVLRCLQENRLVGILADQSPRENAVPVRFFGQPCWATIGPAMAALRFGVPVHVVTVRRDPDGRIVLSFTEELPVVKSGETHRDLLENTQRYQEVLEAAIRKDPGQWLWMHRRWKQRPKLEEDWKARLARAKKPSE